MTIHENWVFFAADTLDAMPARVPGTVHTDLMDNGIIGDPYYRTNEKNQQWIDKKDWTYETYFDVPQNILDNNQIELTFHGLDTYAEVFLNGERLLVADNFFRTWKAPVKNLLKSEENHLKIEFTSPVKKGLSLLEEWGYPLPAINDQSENGELGDKKVSVFTRKPGYHYGWDWGPRLVTTGIWQDITLTGWNDLKIGDVHYQQTSVTNDQAQLTVKVSVISENDTEAEVRVNMDEHTGAVNAQLKKGINTISVPITIDSPKLWWTFELGEPYLYQANVSIQQ